MQGRTEFDKEKKVQQIERKKYYRFFHFQLMQLDLYASHSSMAWEFLYSMSLYLIYYSASKLYTRLYCSPSELCFI